MTTQSKTPTGGALRAEHDIHGMYESFLEMCGLAIGPEHQDELARIRRHVPLVIDEATALPALVDALEQAADLIDVLWVCDKPSEVRGLIRAALAAHKGEQE